MAKLIEINDVYAGYGGDAVLKGVNLDIYDNDFIGVIGPNGGGKTTLLKLLLGIIKPYRGKIQYFPETRGQDLNIGYLPQIQMIDKQFPISVVEVVLSGLMSKRKLLPGYTRQEKDQARKMLSRMGILHLEKNTIGDLSGGELQRVLLCRAIISNPRMLLLDEPNTFVDNQFEGELYEFLKELNEQMAILLVTHDLGTITPYVKTIACVNRVLHYHKSNVITEKQLSAYNCPIQLITHGEVPHTVLGKHNKS
ncbi:MAG: metal ABC transporter ATP-binding protein [Bacteroidota bacterium]